MGFSRFLNNKPLDLSGIKQFTPDLNVAEKTLDSITSGYDEVQALSNAIPKYMQGDSKAMRAKQDEYRAGIQKVADAYANQGSGSGNALLRSMKSTIQSDFSTTGDVYRMGENYNQRELMKERLIANKVPSKFAESYLNKYVPENSFDADGNFQSYEAGIAPTIPNYSEIAINAAAQIIPKQEDIDHIEYAADGVTPIAIITNKKKRIEAANIQKILNNTMGGIIEVQNSLIEFGDPAKEAVQKAIQGAMGIFAQNDIAKKIQLVPGGKGKPTSSTPTSDGTRYISNEIGEILVGDNKLKTQEEFKTDAKGDIIGDVYLDKENTNDAVEIKENLDKLFIETEDVKKDLINSANGNLAETIINHQYINKTYLSDVTAPIDQKPSEHYMRDEYVEDELNLGIDEPLTRYQQGIQNYTIATAMQDASNSESNFLLATKEELKTIKNTDDLLDMYKSKTEGKTEEEIQALLDTYDEADITEKFNRSLAKADVVINKRNRVVYKKQVIEQEVDKAWRSDLVEGDIKLLDGENLTNDEWAQVAKHYGKEGDLTNIFGVAQDKAGIKLKIEDFKEREATLNEEITYYEGKVDELKAASNSKLAKTLNSKKEQLKEVKNLKKQQENLLKNSPETSNKLENFKEKHLEYLNTADKSEYIADAVRNNYSSVQTRGIFTNLKTVGGVPNLQSSPKSNQKLTTLEKVEHAFAAQLGAVESGKGKDATYRQSSGFDLGQIIDVASGKNFSEEQIVDGEVVGVEYLGLTRDAEGVYEMVGRVQYLNNEGLLVTGDRVRVQNPSFDKKYRQLLYSGKPLLIKQSIDPLWDELTLTNDSFVEDKAILGDGYALRLVKDSDGNTDGVIWDLISNKMVTDGKLEDLKDSYDLSDRLGGLLRGNIAKSWDKELEWNKLMSFEDGFREGNFVFAKDSFGNELVERRALDEEFANTFINGFKDFKSNIIINSMVRSLDNQKALMKSENNNNSPKQLTSGHLIGEGVDIHNDPDFIKEFEKELNKEGKTLEQVKEGYVTFRGMKIWYHNNYGSTGMHLDIKKI